MHIVITGVTRGLGRALAEWYIAQGQTVSGCGRSGMEIFELRSVHPESHNFDAVDVTEVVKVGMLLILAFYHGAVRYPVRRAWQRRAERRAAASPTPPARASPTG